MIHKLPRWVWAGAFVLAFVAGMINVVGLLGFEQIPVSHLTATVSKAGIALAHQQAGASGLFLLGVIGSFFAGAMLSGALLKSAALQLGRRYSAALLIESGLIALAMVLLQRDQSLGVNLLCFACGLQNGMASTFSGAIVRTTHMTGIITDFGVLCGQALRGMEIDWRRALLCIAILSGFIGGGIAGALLFSTFGYQTLLIPVAITASASAGYAIWSRRVAP